MPPSKYSLTLPLRLRHVNPGLATHINANPVEPDAETPAVCWLRIRISDELRPRFRRVSRDPDTDAAALHAPKTATRQRAVQAEFLLTQRGLSCGWELEVPLTLNCFGMNGGDDGARTRDLCRDRAAL